jgi:hypothetical protein
LGLFPLSTCCANNLQTRAIFSSFQSIESAWNSSQEELHQQCCFLSTAWLLFARKKYVMFHLFFFWKRINVRNNMNLLSRKIKQTLIVIENISNQYWWINDVERPKQDSNPSRCHLDGSLNSHTLLVGWTLPFEWQYPVGMYPLPSLITTYRKLNQDGRHKFQSRL